MKSISQLGISEVIQMNRQDLLTASREILIADTSSIISHKTAFNVLPVGDITSA